MMMDELVHLIQITSDNEEGASRSSIFEDKNNKEA